MHGGCAQPASVERRTLHHLRNVIDNAPLMQKIVLRCLARDIGVEGLRKLDSNLSDPAFANSLESKPGKRALSYLRQLVDEAEGEARNALRFMTRKKGVENLGDVEIKIRKLRKNPEKVKI